MSLIFCRECGEKISSKAASCPHCGLRNNSNSFESEKNYILLAIGIAIFFFIFIPLLKFMGVVYFFSKLFS